MTTSKITVTFVDRVRRPSWGDPFWVKWVKQRDEMLRGVRPAYVCEADYIDPFHSRRCPVCGSAKLNATICGELFCPCCTAEFEVRMLGIPGITDHQGLFLLPGQEFDSRYFPKDLPKAYPIGI